MLHKYETKCNLADIYFLLLCITVSEEGLCDKVPLSMDVTSGSEFSRKWRDKIILRISCILDTMQLLLHSNYIPQKD